MNTLLLVISCILCGLFGWWLADIVIVANYAKKELGHDLKGLEVWKVWTLEIIFVIVILLNSITVSYRDHNRVYNTKEYTIETVDTTFDSDSTEVSTFKIVRK